MLYNTLSTKCFMLIIHITKMISWMPGTYLYDMIRYICQLQLGKHPVAAVQYAFTHKQYIEQHK